MGAAGRRHRDQRGAATRPATATCGELGIRRRRGRRRWWRRPLAMAALPADRVRAELAPRLGAAAGRHGCRWPSCRGSGHDRRSGSDRGPPPGPLAAAVARAWRWGRRWWRWRCRGTCRPWPATTSLAYRGGGFLLSGGALLAGAWLALRDRTTGAAELVAVTPTAPWRLWRARLAGVAAVAAGVFAVGFAAALAVSAGRGGRGAPDLRLLADGVLAVVLSGWVGLAVGRLSGSRMVAVLAAPVWVVLSCCRSRGRPEPAGLSLSVQHLAPVLNLLRPVGRLRVPARPALAAPGLPARAHRAGGRAAGGAGVPRRAASGGPAAPAGGRRGRPGAAPGRPGPRLLALPDAVLVLGPDRATWRPVEGELRRAGRGGRPPIPAGASPPTARHGPAPGTRPCRPACTRPTASGWPGTCTQAIAPVAAAVRRPARRPDPGPDGAGGDGRLPATRRSQVPEAWVRERPTAATSRSDAFYRLALPRLRAGLAIPAAPTITRPGSQGGRRAAGRCWPAAT